MVTFCDAAVQIVVTFLNPCDIWLEDLEGLRNLNHYHQDPVRGHPKATEQTPTVGDG